MFLTDIYTDTQSVTWFLRYAHRTSLIHRYTPQSHRSRPRVRLRRDRETRNKDKNLFLLCPACPFEISVFAKPNREHLSWDHSMNNLRQFYSREYCMN